MKDGGRGRGRERGGRDREGEGAKLSQCLKQTPRMRCPPVVFELAPHHDRRRSCVETVFFFGIDQFSLIELMFGTDYVNISKL